jgi:hypothetical protein
VGWASGPEGGIFLGRGLGPGGGGTAAAGPGRRAVCGPRPSALRAALHLRCSPRVWPPWREGRPGASATHVRLLAGRRRAGGGKRRPGRLRVGRARSPCFTHPHPHRHVARTRGVRVGAVARQSTRLLGVRRRRSESGGFLASLAREAVKSALALCHGCVKCKPWTFPRLGYELFKQAGGQPRPHSRQCVRTVS